MKVSPIKLSLLNGLLVISVDIGGGYWTFNMVNSDWVEPEPDPTINITFQVQMSGTEVSEEGVFIGGGEFFANHDTHPMEHVGEDVYVAVVTVPANNASHYTYINGGWWDAKENIGGQSCSDPYYFNDRFIEWGDEDIIVNNCFGLCGDGICSDLPEPTFVNVEFNVDMIDFDWEDGVKADTVWVTGSYEGWSGKGDPLFDEDGDHIYSAVIPFYENGGIVEYKYTINGWDSPASGAIVGSECDFNLEDGGDNYGFFVENENIELPAYIFGGGCDVRDNEQEVCELVNCDNLQFAHVMSPDLFKSISLHLEDSLGLEEMSSF